MAISDFQDIADKIFNKLLESFPVSQQIDPNDILGAGTVTVERGRPVDSKPDQTEKVRGTINWLSLNEYVHSSGDYYAISEKWLKLKGVNVFS